MGKAVELSGGGALSESVEVGLEVLQLTPPAVPCSVETEGEEMNQLHIPATVQPLAGLPCLPRWAAHLTVNPTSLRLLCRVLGCNNKKSNS